MKITPFKNRLYAVACAALLTFTVGCEKEVPVPAANGQDALPEARFKKQLSIGAQNRSDASFVVEVGASEQRLLNEIDASSFLLALNPDAGSSESQGEEAHEDAALATLKPGQNVVSIRVLGVNASKAMESYTIDFSDGFKRLARKEGLATRIVLRPDESLPAQTAKAAGWWYRTPYCRKITTYGDGGSISTGVTVYYAYLSGSVWRQAPLHTFYFFHNASCNSCAHGVSYLDDIWVFRDVLTGVTISMGC